MQVNSENSQGYCIPTNSSADEIIAGLARASAIQNAGQAGSHATAIIAGSVVGVAVLVGALLLAVSMIMLRRRRRFRGGSGGGGGFSDQQLHSFSSLPVVRGFQQPTCLISLFPVAALLPLSGLAAQRLHACSHCKGTCRATSIHGGICTGLSLNQVCAVEGHPLRGRLVHA
jgi:hypothetical protein